MSGPNPREARSVRESLTEMTELVLPQHTNVLGSVFGGTVMAWIDVCGAITAQRHCRRIAVTAAVDELSFLAPIKLGDVVCLSGRVNAAFSTSVEVGVRVEVEDKADGSRRPCVEALMTFVSVADDGKPALAPALRIETPEEAEREAQAKERRAERLARRTKPA